MTRTALLLLLLTGCTPTSDDSAAPPLADLTGTLLDPYADDAPVEGAWIVVDGGGSIASTRSGADGSFTLPGLPAEDPVTLTFLAEDRVAMTFQDFVLADHPDPLTITGCTLRDISAYDFPTLDVEGTISGAPGGSYVLLYGEDDYHDYVSGGDEPVPFGFTARALGDTFRFSAFAIDAAYATLAVGYAEVDATAGDVTDLDLTLTPAEELAPRAFDFDRPVRDGAPLQAISADDCIYAGSAFPGFDSGVVTGWAETCAATDAGFHVEMSYLPTDDDHVSVYASPDIYGATYAYAVVPIDGASLDVTLLDSPVVASRDAFGPGADLSWTPVTGADEHLFGAYDEVGTVWMVYTGAGGHAAFPELPDGAPLPTLMGDAAWLVYARSYEVTDQGTLDSSAPYQLSATAGGPAAW